MQQKQSLTVRIALAIVAGVCFIIGFLPTFKVTGNIFGQKMSEGVSIFQALRADANFGTICVFFVPIIIIVLLLLKLFAKVEALTDKVVAGVVIGLSAFDFFSLISAMSSFKRSYSLYSIKAGATFWMILDIILLLVLIAGSVLSIIGVVNMDMDIVSAFSPANRQNTLNQMKQSMNQATNSMTQMAGNVVNSINNPNAQANSVCPRCGGILAAGYNVCPTCGTPVAPAAPQQMMQQPMQQMAPQQPMQQMPPQAPNYGVGAPQQAPTYGVGAPVQQMPPQQNDNNNM